MEFTEENLKTLGYTKVNGSLHQTVFTKAVMDKYGIKYVLAVDLFTTEKGKNIYFKFDCVTHSGGFVNAVLREKDIFSAEELANELWVTGGSVYYHKFSNKPAYGPSSVQFRPDFC